MSYLLEHYPVIISIIFSSLISALLTKIYYSRYRIKQLRDIITIKQQEIDSINLSLQNLNNQLLQFNDAEKKLIAENERLHNEINHRVNNNLQTTISLLNMQSAYASNEDALEAIKNIQRRIYAISLVNKKVNSSDSLPTIDMKEYIEELVLYLRDIFNVQNSIEFELLTQSIRLNLTYAVPLGLIINEAITNSIKYAFPIKKMGKIVIQLERGQGLNIKLTIRDDGIGLPNFFGDNHDTLGKNLIRGLSGQLQGELTMGNNFGSQLIVIFDGH